MKHYLTSLAILAMTAAVHTGISHVRSRAARQAPPQGVLAVPARIGPYEQAGPDYEVGDNIRRALETSAILMRPYRDRNGWPIQLTIVYAGTTRRSLHFPEVCLVGQGWEVREQTAMPVGFLFTASKLVLVKNDKKDAVLYWFKTGDKFTGNFFVNSWHWARNQLTRGTATSAMIKVSAPMGRRDEESVFLMLEDFAAKLVPILEARVK